MELYYIILILLVPAIGASLFAVILQRRTLRTHGGLTSSGGVTASDVANRILKAGGCGQIRVRKSEISPRNLYSPARGMLTLSTDVFDDDRLPSIATAAFESAHALQEKAGNRWIGLREGVTRGIYALRLACWPVFIIGLIFAWYTVALIGGGLFTLLVVAAAAMLPVERDAAKRACRVLRRGNYLAGGELIAGEKLVRACAYTCLAAPMDGIVKLAAFLIHLCSDASKPR